MEVDADAMLFVDKLIKHIELMPIPRKPLQELEGLDRQRAAALALPLQELEGLDRQRAAALALPLQEMEGLDRQRVQAIKQQQMLDSSTCSPKNTPKIEIVICIPAVGCGAQEYVRRII